ncbi:MAG: CapA family protein [Proteobacteria bacterium]|nr:CapA family protein [Pseudomonadota bacterium]
MIIPKTRYGSLGPVRTVVLTLAGLMLFALIFAIVWLMDWTYFVLRVRVPPPIEARFGDPQSQGRASVLFLGDFAPTDAALPAIKKRGYSYPFEATRELVHSYDAAVANLEAPITTRGNKALFPKQYVYKIHPEAVAEIRRAGIDAVTLANNHAFDYGRHGLADTIDHLDTGEILHAGAHLSQEGARRGLVFNTPGGRLGILAYIQNKPQWRLNNLAFVHETLFYRWPGVARLVYRDLAEDITRMKRFSDIVAVVVHWGENYTPVNRDQKILGQVCVDLGADVVIGHHPHWYQPVRLYRGRPVIYSLGNYAFGTPGNRRMRFGMGAALYLAGGRITDVEFIPLLTQNRIVKFQPHIPEGKRLKRFFSKFLKGSRELGAAVERRGNRAWLELKSK